MKKILPRLFVGVLALLVLAAALLWFLNTRDEDLTSTPITAASLADAVQRGAYLSKAGNCMVCHTEPGGAAYAGGRGMGTPFGTIFTSNLTPDPATGIGSWNSGEFWRALHNGRSKSGRLLYPAFPYPDYTKVTREDSDALFAYFKTLTPVVQANRPHELGFPYQSQLSLAVWRALFFSPGVYKPEPQQTAEWNRGAYLVNGLGHCNSCHTTRNAFGASSGLDLSGGLIPVQNWYAPSLLSNREAGTGNFELHQIISLLKTGVSANASVSGPMAEVVLGSTQYMNDADLQAMATFLKALPSQASSIAAEPELSLMSRSSTSRNNAPSAALIANGAKIYEAQCAQCHGDKGQGIPDAYPALAGNRAVLMQQPVNLVQTVLNGGYPPSTQGNPRPFGMPPFVLVLNDNDLSAVLTHIRTSWGNNASAVSALEVNRLRAGSGR